MNTNPCTHEESERQWIGTYHTNELKLAISKGYRIVEAYELWHYPKEQICQYDNDKEDGGESIFGSYITLFTKVKMESSGFPPGVVTEDEKDAYIERVRVDEQIVLRKEAIKKNPGMRYIAKLALNSLWGKLSQRSDKNTTKMFGKKDLGNMMRLLSNPAYEVTDFHIGEKAVSVTYKASKEWASDCDHSNVMLAATITSAARCHLYSFMDKIPEQIIYLDTDSLIWLRKPGMPTLTHGSYLGIMKSELPENEFIRCVVCCGAKSYAYITSSGECTCRVKGFTLNHKNSKIINFASMKHMMCTEPNSALETVNDSKIFRDRRNFIIYSKKEVKKFTITNNKRVYHETYKSSPYGYTVE